MALVLGAMFMAFAAIMPWIHMRSHDLYGSQVYVVVPRIGDGKLIALFGLLIVALRISLAWLPRWRSALLLLIVALAVGSATIAAYDAFRTWEGDRTVWLYAVMALGVIVALCAGLLMGGRAQEVEPEAEPAGEVTETWA